MIPVEAVRLIKELDARLGQMIEHGATDADLRHLKTAVNSLASTEPLDETNRICKDWLALIEKYEDSSMSRTGGPAAYFEEMKKYNSELRRVIDPRCAL